MPLHRFVLFYFAFLLKHSPLKLRLCLSIIFLKLGLFGQQYNLSNSLQTINGLPSNHVYDLCEDQKGFLWIATDNGTVRFDGKNFLNYTTSNGLPSNDVLRIVMEKKGTIWAVCYNQPPSYFDEKSNRFVSFESNKTIKEISSLLLQPIILKNGGIVFKSAKGNLKFLDHKLIAIYKSTTKIEISKQNSGFSLKSSITPKKTTEIRLLKNKMSVYSFQHKESTISVCELENEYYVFFSTEFYRIRKNLSRKNSKKIYIGEKVNWYKFHENELHVFTENGTIINFDLKTLKKKIVYKNRKGSNITSSLFDKNKNLWIGTIENGLEYYTKSPIKTYSTPKISNNFLSILKTKDAVYAGNYSSQLITIHHSKTKVHSLNNSSKKNWIRFISSFNKKVIAVSDNGYAVNFGSLIPIYYHNLKISLKTACKLNDSILIIGSNDGLFKLNALTNYYCSFLPKKVKILALEKNNESSFYFLTNEGLFLYSFKNNKVDKILNQFNFNQLAFGSKDEIWISTFKGDLLLLRNKKIYRTIKNSEGLPENITKIIATKNRLWIASKTGLYILTKNDFKIYKLSKFDGLPSQEINAICLNNDTIYAATTNGIAQLPVAMKIHKYDINPTITTLKINNELFPVRHFYKLDEEKKSISIQLAGVDLSGHFKKFQYALNNSSSWQNLEGNNLNLILKGGENLLAIRAMDVNENIGKKTIRLHFNVDLPFYTKIWFWILTVFGSSFLVFILILRRRLSQTKKEFEKQLALEQQRSAITADLHDEIGSSLSSLQINSAIANIVYESDPDQTKKILTKIEVQAELLAERVGDIIWSMKPGNEEFLALSSRIKNFTNDILGETKIKYSFQIDQSIDTFLTKVSIRKNLLLFMKEAINNAAKYSQAKQLKISLSIVNQEIQIEISDDGIGFDTTITKGNGLGNMQKRIAEINGNLTIVSEPNKGTIITATIPIVP